MFVHFASEPPFVKDDSEIPFIRLFIKKKKWRSFTMNLCSCGTHQVIHIPLASISLLADVLGLVKITSEFVFQFLTKLVLHFNFYYTYKKCIT